MPRTIEASRLRCALFVLLATSFGAACDRDPGRGGSSGIVLAAQADSDAVFGKVVPFALTERSGKTILREDLAGKPWIAGMVFTRCTGPCPKITANMRALQDRLAGTPAVLVTFSVDPQWDTPEVLRQYARDVGADPQRWLFLTGPETVLDSVIRESFALPVERAQAGSAPIGQHVTHRTQLIAIDKWGGVRGYYEGESDAGLDALVARVRHLERERAPPPAR